MAKLSHYPPWRRVALQIIMWLIFGASIGTAAIVSVHLRASGVAFDREITCGRFAVMVPGMWRTNGRDDADESIITSVEPHRPADNKRPPRRLMFVGRTVPPDATAEDVLQLEAPLGVGQGGLTDAASVGTASIVGSDADIYVRSNLRSVAILVMIPTSEYLAAVIEPDGSSLAVKMSCDGAPDASDLVFFRSVLGRVERARM